MNKTLIISNIGKTVSDAMIVAASKSLAAFVTDEEIAAGNIYPPISEIRKISAHIATQVIITAKSEGLTSCDIPNDQLLEFVTQHMYNPTY